MRAAKVQPRERSGARVKTVLLATTLLALGAPPALAQDTIQTLPGANTYQLPPGNSQATPSPSPTPTTAPTPSVAPLPPVVRTAPTPTPTPTPVPTVTRVPTPQPSPTPAPQATETPTPVPIAPPSPVAEATPQPLATPTALATPSAVATPGLPAIPTPADGRSGWLWWLAGLGLAGGAVVALLAWRRRHAESAAVIYEPVAPPPASPPPAPKPKSQAPIAPTRTALPVTPAATPARPIALDFRPQRLWTRGPNAFLAFELVLTNAGAGPLSGVRPVVTLASAGPGTAAELAGFAAQISALPGAEPFDLRAGETRKVAGELTLPGDAMHVTTVAEREMIVPVAMIGLAWRGGLSVASAAEAFVIGAGDPTSPKLGPIWVDRPGQVFDRLDARRFTPR